MSELNDVLVALETPTEKEKRNREYARYGMQRRLKREALQEEREAKMKLEIKTYWKAVLLAVVAAVATSLTVAAW